MADNKDLAWQNWFAGSAYEDSTDDLTLSLTKPESSTPLTPGQNLDGVQLANPQPAIVAPQTVVTPSKPAANNSDTQATFMATPSASSLPSSPIASQTPPSPSANSLNSNQKPRRRGLWIVVILLLLLGVGGLMVKRGHDARLAQLEQNQQQAEQQRDRLQSEVDAIVINDNLADGDVTVTDDPDAPEPADPTSQGDKTTTPTSTGSQGLQGTMGANGATGSQGATGPEGSQGSSGTATCPNGDCLSLQTNPSTTQETGSINISGDGDFGGEVNAAAVNTANIATTGLTVYGTLAGTDANFTETLEAIDILQGGNTVCDDSNNCNYAAATGGSGYIQNQTASPQTAGFNISGNGYFGGNVGVGTTNPQAKLEIQSGFGTEVLRFAYDVNNYHSISTSFNGGNPAANYLGFNVESAINDTRRVLTLQGDGAVGIGTSLVIGDSGLAPKLVVANPSDTTQWLGMGYDNDGQYGFLYAVDNGTAWKNLVLAPAGGNVGIGITNPVQKFHVGGSGPNYIKVSSTKF